MKQKSLILFFFTSLLLIVGGCGELQDRKLRTQRARVKSLIAVGQNIDDAQNILRSNGYKLFFEEPIQPTIDKSYLQQLVIIGNTQPSAIETISYVTQKKIPGTRSESPYVVILSGPDRKITVIE